MNIYFLVEGRRTEKKVYPKWLSFLVPELSMVSTAYDAMENNYFVFSGNGYPSLLNNHLRNSIDEINEYNNFDYLVLCLDADEVGVEEREGEVEQFIKNNNLYLDRARLVIIVQNKCIESWFLGNKKVYSRQPQSEELISFTRFYNVKENDPELMDKREGYETTSIFHHDYLKELLKEKNIKYTKNNPGNVVEQYYLNQLIKRSDETSHIRTFKQFVDFCNLIRSSITQQPPRQ